MEPATQNGTIYEFDEFRLIPNEDLLLRNGRPVPLNPKALHVLVLLVERNGHLVHKSEILNLIWQDSFVEEGSLSKAIWFVRHALGDTSRERFIQTVPRRGYRFVFPVSVITNLSGAFRLADVPGHFELDGAGSPSIYRNIPDTQADFVADDTSNGDGKQGARNGHEPLTSRSGTPSLRSNARSYATMALAGIGILAVAICAIALAMYYFSLIQVGAFETKSIAILPLKPIDPAVRSEVYEVGTADAIINWLSGTPDLVVRSYSATRIYAGLNKDAQEAGRELGVEYVLESSYQIADGKIKISSRLLKVSTGQVEDTFQSRQAIADIFSAQDAIASDIGGQVIARLGISERPPSKKRGTDNEEAYLAYLQGIYLLDRQNPNPITDDAEPSPIESFDRAVSLDPKYARAWAGKALAHTYAALMEPHDGENNQKAREAIEMARSIDPNESMVYSALCHQKLFDEWNYKEAEQAGRRAVEYDPASSFARSEYATLLTSRGRFSEALDHFKKAMETAPTSFRVRAFYANTLFMARRYDEAAAQYKRLLDLKPNRAATYSWLVRVAEAQGKEAEAYEWTVKYMDASKQSEQAIQRYKTAYATSGYRGALSESINLGIMKAHAYAYLGDKDKAFASLEESYKKRNYYLVVFGVVDPLYDSLRGDPRWTELIQRIETRASSESQ